MTFLVPTDLKGSRPVPSTLPEETVNGAGFSELEWSIVRLTRGDGLWTIREPGLLRRIYQWLLGRNSQPRLASDRLEALRRMAVLSRHFGFSVPGEDVSDFLSAGFTLDQYELLVSSLRAARRSRANAREALA